jgi:hypothetical protein
MKILALQFKRSEIADFEICKHTFDIVVDIVGGIKGRWKKVENEDFLCERMEKSSFRRWK